MGKEQKFWYLLVDRNKTYKLPCAYCRHYKRYLSISLMKTHRCESRQCPHMFRLNHEYWEEKRRRKEIGKQRRQKYHDERIRKSVFRN